MKRIKHLLQRCMFFGKRFCISLQIPLKIDVHVVEHCNLNCKGCTHFSPIAKPEYLDIVDFSNNIKHLTKIEKSIGSIQLLGGEPLLHPRLSEIINVTRKNLSKTNIHIITNGILLTNEKKLPVDFWETCKKNNVLIRITKYPSVNYDVIERKCIEKEIKYEWFEDRGTKNRNKGWSFFPLYINGWKHISNRYKFLKLLRCGSFNCLQLVGTKIYPCSHVAYVRHLNNYFNYDFKVIQKDSVEITKIKNSFAVRKLLFMSTPFCKYCGYGYKSSHWAQSNKTADEWIEF